MKPRNLAFNAHFIETVGKNEGKSRTVCFLSNKTTRQLAQKYYITAKTQLS